jgi:hypothetical protein
MGEVDRNDPRDLASIARRLLREDLKHRRHARSSPA